MIWHDDEYYREDRATKAKDIHRLATEQPCLPDTAIPRSLVWIWLHNEFRHQEDQENR
jgi:hypothetical protein